MVFDGEELWGNVVYIRPLRQRQLDGIAYPAREGELRHTHALRRLARAVFEFGEGTACRDEICLATAPTLISRSGRIDRQACLDDLLGDEPHHGLGIVAIKPGDRGIAIDLDQSRFSFGNCAFDIMFTASASQFAFFCTREFLTDTDAAHGHEIARETVAVPTIDGQGVDTELEDQ